MFMKLEAHAYTQGVIVSEESKIVVNHCMKVAMSFVLVVICFNFAFVGTSAAHASAPVGARNGPLVVIKNILCCGESGVLLGQVQVNPKTSGSISELFTVSNNFSASVAIPAWTVSATLGFDVSLSYKFMANCSAGNTTNQIQNLNYYAEFTIYDFELWQSGQKVGVGSANKYAYDQCFYSASVPVGH